MSTEAPQINAVKGKIKQIIKKKIRENVETGASAFGKVKKPRKKRTATVEKMSGGKGKKKASGGKKKLSEWQKKLKKYRADHPGASLRDAMMALKKKK